MSIDIKGTELELTLPIKEYIHMRFEPLSRFVKRYEEKKEIRMFLEIARTTKHHHKGDVFYAEVTLELPKQVLRAEATSNDIRSAIDAVKDVLKREMTKYKETHSWKS